MLTSSIMTADKIISGITAETVRRCAALTAAGHRPGVGLVLIDDDPYAVRMLDLKIRRAKDLGVWTHCVHLPKSSTEQRVLRDIAAMNEDPRIDGIFIQAPLPAHLDAGKIYSSLDPNKDVDGYHPFNLGKLAMGSVGFVPCAALGGIMMLQDCLGDLTGKQAVVVGRSAVLGKPLALLLLHRGCTVTVAHSKTQALGEIVGRADIVVTTVGTPGYVQGAWIKQGATILDFGASRVNGRIVGDVDFEAVNHRAEWINRPTGSIGPMTIALLLRQTVAAADLIHGKDNV